MITSEATAPIRYQVPPFRADLTDLFHSTFLCVLPWITFIISFIASFHRKFSAGFLEIFFIVYKLWHTQLQLLSTIRCQYRSKYMWLSSTKEAFSYFTPFATRTAALSSGPNAAFFCFFVFCKLSPWRPYTTIARMGTWPGLLQKLLGMFFYQDRLAINHEGHKVSEETQGNLYFLLTHRGGYWKSRLRLAKG